MELEKQEKGLNRSSSKKSNKKRNRKETKKAEHLSKIL